VRINAIKKTVNTNLNVAKKIKRLVKKVKERSLVAKKEKKNAQKKRVKKNNTLPI